ncbi:MAG: hypothetical protein ACOYBR_10480 [Fluviibacter sp.]
MAVLAPEPKAQFFAADGTPLVGGKVYTYAAGTTTPLSTFTDASALTPNTNPIILDARGECNLWFATATSYKVILKDENDVLQWSVDNIATYGTIASQNSNNVTITGGTITGVTATFNLTGDVSGNAGTVTNGVYLTATQTLTNKTITGLASASTVNDSLGTGYAIGYRKTPQSSNTTAAAADVGKHLFIGATATIPSGVFAAGDWFQIVNSSAAAITITQGAGTTLRLAGTATTGNRTLAAYGVANVLCTGSEVFYLNGVT